MRKAVYFFIALFLVIVWASWADLSSLIAKFFLSADDKKNISVAGSWGDSFGAFNALVSIGAFITVFATLQIQFKAIKDQAADAHKQRFEASFFELIRIMKEARENVTFSLSRDYQMERLLRISPNTKRTTPPISIKRQNISAIQEAVREVTFWVVEIGSKRTITKNDFVNVYMRRVHSRSEATIAPYFRIIYTILYKIKSDTVLSEKDKEYYANLLRSQLTTFEITLMAINALAPVAKDFAALITHFRMLKYLPEGNARKRLRRVYPAIAFKARS